MNHVDRERKFKCAGISKDMQTSTVMDMPIRCQNRIIDILGLDYEYD